ncbi:MAG: hypothetical protein IPH58_19280 [Sphingobacteriales bacterium]|jgi:hypothetical protein|nr:hypothetical protein [Sphingobacteriales bacterium]
MNFKTLKGYGLLFAFLFMSIFAQAEGSKDLYLTGPNTGYRAFLSSWPWGETGLAFNPFPTPGRMWVYANVGETI